MKMTNDACQNKIHAGKASVNAENKEYSKSIVN